MATGSTCPVICAFLVADLDGHPTQPAFEDFEKAWKQAVFKEPFFASYIKVCLFM
jgi:hypothetical protein